MAHQWHRGVLTASSWHGLEEIGVMALPYGATSSPGQRIAEVRRGDVLAFVTLEADGLFYTWRQRTDRPSDPYWGHPHWYLAFSRKAAAVSHMRKLAEPDSKEPAGGAP